MGNSRRETIITPAAGIAPRNIIYSPNSLWLGQPKYFGEYFSYTRIPPHTGLIARSADVLFYPQAIS